MKSMVARIKNGANNNWPTFVAVLIGLIPSGLFMFYSLAPGPALIGAALMACGLIFSFFFFSKYSKTVAAGTMVFLSELEDRLSQINERNEEMTIEAIKILDQIVKKSREGSEEADSVVEYFMGRQGSGKNMFGQSFVSNMLVQNEAAVTKAGKVFREVSLTNKVFLEELKKITTTVEDVCNFVTEIQKVALQTRVLSLNAAIEAARAGEHGQGFAVVSDHVRRLANHSGEMAEGITIAAQQARTILNDMETRMDQWVTQGNEEMREAESSLRTTLDKFKSSIDNVSEAIGVLTLNYQTISKEIANATVTLQFQDIIGQNVSYLKAGLHQTQARLAGMGFFFTKQKKTRASVVDRPVLSNEEPQSRPSSSPRPSPPQMKKTIATIKSDDDDSVTFF